MLHESIFTLLVEEYLPISYPGTNLSSLHWQMSRFVLVSPERVLLRGLSKNVPHCLIPLSYAAHAYPQKEWRKEYNQVRPHSALDYRPPAPRGHRSIDSNLTSGNINGAVRQIPMVYERLFFGQEMQVLISIRTLAFLKNRKWWNARMIETCGNRVHKSRQIDIIEEIEVY